MRKFIIILLIVLLNTTGCAVRMEHSEIPLADREIIKNYSLPDNKGRVVFYLGKMFGVKMDRAADIYINEIKVGTIGNREEMVVVDLPPNNYFFKWNVPQEDIDYSNTQPAILKLPVQNGQTTYLVANFIDKTSAAAYLFGAFAGAFAKFATVFDQDTLTNGQQAIASQKIVVFERNFGDQSPVSTNQNPASVPATQHSTESQKGGLKVDQQQVKSASEEAYAKLENLKKMYDSKLITREEYDQKRQKLVDGL